MGGPVILQEHKMSTSCKGMNSFDETAVIYTEAA